VRPEFTPARVRLSDDNKDDFRASVGDLYTLVVTSLTGLSSAQNGQLGGVEVVQGDRVLWQKGPAGDIPGQLLGVWFREREPLPGPEHAPTGAILPRKDTKLDAKVVLALDLVHVQDVWLPLSEAGVHSYVHSNGMLSGERWSFVTKPTEGSSPVVFDAKFTEALSSTAVTGSYGATAAERARPDYPTIQLELHRRA